MNEMNSIRKISGSSTSGVPCGHEQGEEAEAVLPEADDQHDREAHDRHHAGDGELAGDGEGLQRPAQTPNGISPSRLANRMNMKTVKTQGMYLRPSGPMLVVDHRLR